MSQSTRAETKTQHPPEDRDSFAHVQNGMANGMERVTSVRRNFSSILITMQMVKCSSACQGKEGNLQLGF